jgi:RNA polymerase sigma-70 factor (ECF subfamily)
LSAPEDDFPLDALKTDADGEYAASKMYCEATRLMLAAKHGDAVAYDQLVAGLRGRAFSVARALVGSRDDALELSQEAFLKAYRARDQFRDGDPFMPWFHRILRNTCFSFLRDKRRIRTFTDHRAGFEEDESDFEIVDPAAGPTEHALSSERARAFWVAFNKLSGKDREILALRHFKDLAYKEIAEALAIPEGTVMSRLFHARRRLREALDPDVFPQSEFDSVRGGAR